MNTSKKRIATIAATMACAATILTLTSTPAAAAMCMVACWDEGGGWAGGGGLGGNPNTGSGGGGSDDGRVGGGGYEGPDLDSSAPSGSGWDDSRLNRDEPEPGEQPTVASILSTDVDVIESELGPADLTSAIELLKQAQADRDQVFNDPDATQDDRDFYQSLVDAAEERVNEAMNASYSARICDAKPYLPWC